MRYGWYGTASKSMTVSGGFDAIDVSARAGSCFGSFPEATLRINGEAVDTRSIRNESDWHVYRVSVPRQAAGTHTIGVEYPNHHEASGCKKSLHLDYVNAWDVNG